MEQIGGNDSMRVVVDDDGVLVASGDIDLAGGPVLDGAILRQEVHGVVTLDLSGVGFIDSSGLRSLLAASRRAGERGSEIVLRAPSAAVLRLLALTGTTDQFRLDDAG
jgi:anti-sigma B factor antagonist